MSSLITWSMLSNTHLASQSSGTVTFLSHGGYKNEKVAWIGKVEGDIMSQLRQQNKRHQVVDVLLFTVICWLRLYSCACNMVAFLVWQQSNCSFQHNSKKGQESKKLLRHNGGDRSKRYSKGRVGARIPEDTNRWQNRHQQHGDRKALREFRGPVPGLEKELFTV